MEKFGSSLVHTNLNTTRVHYLLGYIAQKNLEAADPRPEVLHPATQADKDQNSMGLHLPRNTAYIACFPAQPIPIQPQLVNDKPD